MQILLIPICKTIYPLPEQSKGMYTLVWISRVIWYTTLVLIRSTGEDMKQNVHLSWVFFQVYFIQDICLSIDPLYRNL